ncbi:MAG: N-acetylmuramoyl-L-alanine amidase [Bacteroidales bacterium]|nr:N-acetylmuramoyl-L-alanine amidase [Bacteroidales bacterium]
MQTLNKRFLLLSAFTLLAFVAIAQDLTGIRIHINPGHGGWDSDDRGISTPLYPNVGSGVGFWESQSNLDKGLQLKSMLEALGATVQISRTQNRTQDDLSLSTIVQMANEFQADFMLSIHSNAGSGTANYVLQLYAGKNIGDTYSYPSATPKSDEGRAISTEIAKNLIKNQLTYWTSANYNVSGDKTYARMYMGWSDGYGVLRGLTVPGVISEGSMHDYIPETYRLMNMEYKWLEAWNFKKAFCTYFKQAEIPTGNIAGYVKDSRNLILDGSYKKYGNDVLLPINGTTVTVLETGQTYTVDNNRNGVFVFKDLASGNYTVKAEAEGYYAQTQQITVVKNEITYMGFKLNKVRNTPPQVISYSPNVAITDSVVTSTNIVLEFNWDMDEASTRAAFSITPAVEGTITFEDSQYRLRFTPSVPLDKSTVYTVKLDKSAKHPDNLSMENDFIFQFTTQNRNRLLLLDSYPANGNTSVYATKPLFFFIFDKALNTTNIRDEINVYKSNGTAISKATRSVKINKVGAPYGDIYFELAEPLIAGNNYTVKLGSNAMDDAGVKLVDPIEINFTASNVAVSDKTIIDDFETDGKYTYDKTQSENDTLASIARSTTQKLFGTSGYKINAAFTDQSASAVYRINDPSVTTVTSKVFGLHVYGDMSGNELQLQFRSETSETDVKYLKLCDLNFIGWQFVEAHFTENEAYKLTGIRLIRKDHILSKSVEIYVDNLLQYDTLISGLNSTLSDNTIQVYPNPASENIFVKTDKNELPLLQLYSLNGILLKTIRDHQMSITEFDQGTYVLKIITQAEVLSKVMMIY